MTDQTDSLLAPVPQHSAPQNSAPTGAALRDLAAADGAEQPEFLLVGDVRQVPHQRRHQR